MKRILYILVASLFMVLSLKNDLWSQSAYSIVDTNWQQFKGYKYYEYWDTTSSATAVYQVKGLPVVAFFGVLGGTVTWTTSWMASTGTFNPDLTPGITFLDSGKFGIAMSSPSIIVFKTSDLTIPTTIYLYIGAISKSATTKMFFKY